MKSSLRIIGWLYSLCLHLYPRAYKIEYSEELKIVFNLTLHEAAQKGSFSIMTLVLQELYALLSAVIFEHRRERKKSTMSTKNDSFLTFEPGSWRETIVALAPFLVFGAFPTFLGYLHLSDRIPYWLDAVIALSMLGLFLSLFGIGIIKRFPRWFLPYIGLPLPLFSVYVFLDMVSNSPYQLQLGSTAPWLLRHFVYQGQVWLGLLVAGVFLVLITRILPPLQPFYWRLRQDWTRLSFILYGATLFALLLTFDDYINEEPYKIASMLLLAGGGWFYLRGTHTWQRFFSLLAGLTLAMAVAAIGKAILYSSPNWPYPRHFTWQTEAMGTVIMGIWLGIAITAPVLLNLAPHPAKHLHTE